MSANSAPVVGTADESSWPQVFQSHADGFRFFCSFVTSGKLAQKDGHAFIEQLADLPYLDRVACSQHIQKLFEIFSRSLASCAIGLVQDGRALFFTFGEAGVYLIRGEKKGFVVPVGKPRTVEGVIRAGDICIVGTAAFFYEVMLMDDGSGDGTNISGHPESAVAWAEELTPRLQVSKHTAHVAAWFFESNLDVTDNTLENPVTSETPQRKLQSFFVVKRVFQKAIGLGVGLSRLLIAKITKRKAGLYSDGAFVGDVLPRSFASKRALTKLLIIGGIVLVLFLGLVLWSKQRALAREKAVQQIIAPYSDKLTSLQKLEATDKAGARLQVSSLLQESSARLDQLKPKSFEHARLSVVVDEIRSFNAQISGEKTVENWQPFYNFQLVKSNFIANKVSRVENNLAFLDAQENAIINLKTDSKQTSVIDTEGITGSKDLAVNESARFVLGAGMYKDAKLLIENNDSTWKSAVLTEAFGTNLYVLDQEDRKLWRYPQQITSKASDGTNWCKNCAGVDLAKVTSITIDGQVWLATSDGEIFTYAQGTRQTFQIKGLVKPFHSTLHVATVPEVDVLVVLEPSEGRLVLLNKHGEYLKSYLAKEFGAVSDFVLSEDGKTAYFAAGSIVYSLGLDD